MRYWLTLGLLVGFVWPLIGGCAQESNDASAYEVVSLTDELNHPWAIAFLPDGRYLISERPGRLRIFADGHLQSEHVQGLPSIAAIGQGGLLDVVLHPDFEENRWLYFTYSAAAGSGYTTRLARARFEHDRLQDLEVLFSAEPALPGGRHFGSRIVFAGEYVYIGIGDRGVMDLAQNTEDHVGTIVRLYHDGRVPEDNPFQGHAGVRPEIYAYGIRNPQGMTLHPVTGVLWEHEHGPRGGDEINLIEAGLNYGWPVITHGIDYSGAVIGDGIQEAAGMEDPWYHWTPSIAPSGMAFYTGEDFPQWQGDLFVGALVQRHLARLTLDAEGRVLAEETMLRDRGRRIRDVRVHDGLIYLLTDHNPGELLRLQPVR